MIFDMSGLEWRPLHNPPPPANLVYSASGNSAHTSIINGKIVMRDRKVQTLDEESIITKAEKAAFEVAKRTGLSKYAKPCWPLY